MFATLLTALGGLVVDSVKGWGERRKVEIEAKARIAEVQANAEITRIQKLADAEVNWDFEALKQGERSWKDEWWTVILSIPLVLVFIPGMEDYILAGFKNLELVPEWYRYAVGITISAAFGFRRLVDLMGKRK